MMSCGVVLEQLHVSDQDFQAAAEVKDDSSDVSEPSTQQHASDKGRDLDSRAKWSSVDKDIQKARKKQGEKMDRDVDISRAGRRGTDAVNSTTLRLTLKRIKVDDSDKDEDACLYVCHSKTANSSKKLVVKGADRSSSTVHKAKADDLKDSGKVKH